MIRIIWICNTNDINKYQISNFQSFPVIMHPYSNISVEPVYLKRS